MSRYFSEFSLVEVQQSFYELPKVKTAQRWRESAPDEFEFTLKAWQLITHPHTSPTYRRLKTPMDERSLSNLGFFRPTDEVMEAWRRTREFALNLRATIVVFQCPSSFTPTQENVGNLVRFFETVDRGGLRFAWEPRGRWPGELVARLCRDLNLIHCVDPFVNEALWPREILYLRLHGVGGYRHRFTDEQLLWLYKTLGNHEATVYCLFNNISSLEDARRFTTLIKDKGD
jgi:uncharacterized protein YecE (DUF72 family)